METFLMTNMCPQHENLNQGAWRSLERWITLEAQERDHLYVIAGPIFGPAPEIVERGPERGIQVPEAFYMIIVDAEREYADKPTLRLIAFRFPQTTPRSANFLDRATFGVSVNDIEEETGLDFFPEYEAMFARWDQKEAAVELDAW
ncbi:MAG: DNA/RNA non-specific endonuclease, partial [Phycisphaerales bacterium]|nr:DNA/RNA non-specific endonuclease [Phycisphaerales bacterium]